MIKKLILFLWLVSIASLAVGNEKDSLLDKLSESIAAYQRYVDVRESRIAFLKNRMKHVDTLSKECYQLHLDLYNEYKPYICDSAIFYLNKNLYWAEMNRDIRKSDDTKLLLSYYMASAGMYKEATDLLESIDRSGLSVPQLSGYYDCYRHVYGELAYYTQDARSKSRYSNIAGLYKDSLQIVVSPGTDPYLEMKEEDFRNAGRWEDALRVNDTRLNNTLSGTPEYALVAYHRALIYRGMKDRKKEKYYLELSALTDVQRAIKDHASLWNLAKILYDEGDIERAYQYIRFSWSETNYYNARSRSLQTAGILSLIDLTYQAMREKQSDTLRFYLILISALSFLLLTAMIRIYQQMKKLSVARNHLQDANVRLNLLNDELQQMNYCLQTANQDLSESNHIKEEYIGRFIKLCSAYIDKLDSYRRMVNKKIQANQIADLVNLTRSREMLDDGLKELYGNFDSAFLRLFPDFVEQFNGLLREGECVKPKKGELLNTELRIFALIRLGIDDSSQIAEFLHYSVNTIYNYRAKVKNKARTLREDFENQVLQIR